MEAPIENPMHIALRFPRMKEAYPELYHTLEWRSGYAFSKPNEVQEQFFQFVDALLKEHGAKEPEKTP